MTGLVICLVFMSILVEKAIMITRGRWEDNAEFAKRCWLSVQVSP